MNHYHPDSEPGSERLFLVEYVNRYNDADYGKIHAKVVRRAVRDRQDPDNPEHTIYADGKNATGYRNCSWSSGAKNALMVEDLIVAGQFELKKGDAVYGADIRYMPYSVEARDAEHMVNTFRKVQKKMDAYYDDFGSANGYADFLRRVAKAMGIKKFLIFTNGGDFLGLDSPNMREFDATSVEFLVDKLVKNARGTK